MIYDKIIYNALWCLASLDAIGNPFEFKTSINKSVLLDYAYDEYAEYKISDDTQMTLFGFIAAQNILREDYFTLENFSIEFKNQYLAWYHTQQEEKSSYFNSLLSKFSSLFSVQAPGLTCLYSLKQIKNGHTVNNDSKGCGSVMRLLPMLLFYKNENHNFTKEMIVYLAQQTGKITHLHPENDIAIKLYMETAMDILDGKEITSKYSHLDNIGHA
jgi:ADP-ribosylglycohydrolase